MTSHSTELIRRARAVHHRIDELAAISDEAGALTRLFLSPSHVRANQTLLGWIRAAGMHGFIDPVGNVVCELPGTTNSQPALMLGSHLDTVRDAGKYDGMLGVLIALDCLEHLRESGAVYSSPIHLIAFGDEEGVRFGSTVLGSRAVAGLATVDDLERVDPDGTTVRDAMIAAGLDPVGLAAASLASTPPGAYVELHIEQGPALEIAGQSLACVTAIVGSHRSNVFISGMSGHAGTVPMAARRDALAAAAECIGTVEEVSQRPGLVGTVGSLEIHPNAGNVIPGRVRFSIDLRSHEEELLALGRADIETGIQEICARRNVEVSFEVTGGAGVTRCDTHLIKLIGDSIAADGGSICHLASGAGHDGIAMSKICPVGMIFVRCAGGISHHPNESVTEADIASAIAATDRFIELYMNDRELRAARGGH